MTTLDLTKLNDGDIVITTEELTNPSPDLRTKRNWKLALTIPKGLKLRVRIKTLGYYSMGDDTIAKLREKTGDDTIDENTPWRFELEPLGGGNGLLYNNKGTVTGIGTEDERKTDKLALALLGVTKPLGDDIALGDLLRQKEMIGRYKSNQCGNLLAILMEHGKLGLADVRMAIAALDGLDYDNGDWDAFEKKHAL